VGLRHQYRAGVDLRWGRRVGVVCGFLVMKRRLSKLRWFLRQHFLRNESGLTTIAALAGRLGRHRLGDSIRWPPADGGGHHPPDRWRVGGRPPSARKIEAELHPGRKKRVRAAKGICRGAGSFVSPRSPRKIVVLYRPRPILVWIEMVIHRDTVLQELRISHRRRAWVFEGSGRMVRDDRPDFPMRRSESPPRAQRRCR